MKHLTYIGVKFFITAYMFAWLFLSIFYKNIYFYGPNNNLSPMSNYNISNSASWFVYFPNQVYLLQFIFSLSSTVSIIVSYKSDIKRARETIIHLGDKRSEFSLNSLANISENKQDDEIETKIPRVLIYYIWSLYTIIFSISYSVTALFFFNEISNQFNLNDKIEILDILLMLNINVFNSIIMTIEFLLTLIPLRIYHFYLPVIYSIIYITIGINVDNSSNTEWYSRVFLIPLILVIHFCGSLAFRFKFRVLPNILKTKIVTFE